MMIDKWVIVDCDDVTSKIKGKYTPRMLVSGQCLIRLTDDNEDLLIGYTKYLVEDIRALDLEQEHKHKEKRENLSLNNPFNSKHLIDGTKLYENVHGVGDEFLAGETKTLRIKVPYIKCYFTEAEIVNAAAGTITDFKFQVDNGVGGYIDVYTHGHSVNISEGYYHRKSNYEAELTDNLYVAATITNGNTDRRVGLNIVLHEAK
tara:strand:- start:3989 stop:4600 length:612 start_codon:yes stop_codon:yes gene_type:complete